MTRKAGIADLDQIAALDMQPVQQGLFRRRAADAVILAGQHVAQILRRREAGAPNSGQAPSTAFSSTSWRSASLPFSQRIGHGAHRDGLGDAALACEEGAFLVRRRRDAPD